jgi:LmbE family N-acetylglucosaminyl deacetylase
MHKFQFFAGNKRPKILCLGAHADDIEIGCGGTILRITKEYPNAEFRWVVFSAEGKRYEEAYQSANSFLTGIETKVLDIHTFKDSYFPFVGSEIKDCFVDLKKNYSPDLIFTHYENDAHQDHQLVAKLTWNAFRDHFILEYEVPKYDGDLGSPNFYVNINEDLVQRKITKICEIFQSQNGKQWFEEETFRSLMRIRGIESNSHSNYAEAFYCRKIVV